MLERDQARWRLLNGAAFVTAARLRLGGLALLGRPGRQESWGTRTSRRRETQVVG